ncbi:alpha/beta hydrolase [Bartonella sp. HY406]|uniref:alpha/beta hydrolase n=1 Tax=Bartonella sp. HY406 TaxID=2979331 RepID=UPI0021C86697|nr:alpha/beta hydrolase [Bartonella sp. HY406]UXN03125.1 alpha/beta hydrolase [Bartonella sp. HY406]
MKKQSKYLNKNSLVGDVSSLSGQDKLKLQDVVARTLPIPSTVSAAARILIGSETEPLLLQKPQTDDEWRSWVQKNADLVTDNIGQLCDVLNVTIDKDEIGGVPIFHVLPAKIAKENETRILLNLHGGGYVLYPHESGLSEAILMAGFGGFKVISVDYRMAPDHPYPAAMDDAFAVYSGLVKQHDPKKIGVFGASTGGGMTLALVLRAIGENIVTPAAIAPSTPWSDLTKTGDSYFVNEGVDNVLVRYDGWLGEAAKLYANGHDMKDPQLSPVYGDFHGFPPTLLTSGTRDLFLSNTVRVHRKLIEAGVETDLIVFEGLSHIHDMMSLGLETQQHFSDIASFFDQYLD